MTFKMLRGFFFLTYILFSFNESLALIGLSSEELGNRLCQQMPQDLSTCSEVDKEQLHQMVTYAQYLNVSAPRLFIGSSEKDKPTFNIMFKNGLIVEKLNGMIVMAEDADIHIDLIEVSTRYTVGCMSYGSFAKLSTDVFKPLENRQHIEDQYATSLDKENESLGNMKTPYSPYTMFYPDGHATCHSIGVYNHSETFRIFTQLSAQNNSSPFVDVPETNILPDDTGYGFIVPCRTNYRMETPPNLVWYDPRSKTKEGTIVNFTALEMITARWDWNVGFRLKYIYNTEHWELKFPACQFGSYVKYFFPVETNESNPSEYLVVGAAKKEVRCGFNTRGDQDDSTPVGKTLYYECFSFTKCSYVLDSGALKNSSRFNGIKPDTAYITVLNQYKFGIISCYSGQQKLGVTIPKVRSGIFFLGLDSNAYLLPGLYPNSSVVKIGQVQGPFYKNHTELHHEFMCTTINFVRSAGIHLVFRHKDFSETVTLIDSDGPNPVMSSEFRFNVTLHTNMTNALCVFLTLDGKLVSAETILQIFDAYPPTVDTSAVHTRRFQVGEFNDNPTLTCPISAGPPPNYRWFFDEKNTKIVQGAESRNLTFRHIHENLTGNYVCEATNPYGMESFEFQVTVQPKAKDPVVPPTTAALSTAAIVGIALSAVLGLLAFGAAIIFALIAFRAKREIRNLTPDEACEFLNGIPMSEGPLSVDGSELALHLPFTKRIESESLSIARDAILGKGQYGVVYRGTLIAEVVAVKTFKSAVTYEEFRAALVEVKLMSFVDEHPNIVRFIGADVTNIEKREIFIIMELSPIGSLEKYLRKLTEADGYVIASSQYAAVDERLAHRTLFGFCEQIAFAMEHLENKRVIHGDLAARNVLVFNHGVVKVTDFGYSRQLYEKNIYTAKKNRALPWRWASIELLRQMEFSTESDIWAYGVTVWEIFSSGNVPFPSEKWNERFMELLEDGLRLKKPQVLSHTQYSFIKECWNVDKSARPRFSQLKAFFSTEKENLCRDTPTTEV